MAGRRSFGAIEKLPSGRHRARYKVAGRWVHSPTTFPTKTEAGIFLDSVRTDMVRGAWKAPRSSRMTLDAYGRKWIEQRETLKATTGREYESCWRNHIGPYIGTRRLDEVTPDVVRDWHARTKARLQAELEAKDAERMAQEKKAAKGARKERRPRQLTQASVRDGRGGRPGRGQPLPDPRGCVPQVGRAARAEHPRGPRPGRRGATALRGTGASAGLVRRAHR